MTDESRKKEGSSLEPMEPSLLVSSKRFFSSFFFLFGEAVLEQFLLVNPSQEGVCPR